MELEVFLDEFEVFEREIGLRFLHSRHQGDRPEEGKGKGKAAGRRRQLGGSGSFRHDSLSGSIVRSARRTTAIFLAGVCLSFIDTSQSPSAQLHSCLPVLVSASKLPRCVGHPPASVKRVIAQASIRIAPYDPEFDTQMPLAREGRRKSRNALRQLKEDEFTGWLGETTTAIPGMDGPGQSRGQERPRRNPVDSGGLDALLRGPERPGGLVGCFEPRRLTSAFL